METIDNDERWEIVIDSFRWRLRQHIVVDQVLDHIHFIGREKKERIRNVSRNEGNPVAVNMLLDEVIKRPHENGWFTAFADALVNSGCELAADYIQLNLPKPEEEAANDSFVRLVEILYPSLVDMKTNEVSLRCYAEKLLTDEDKQVVEAETQRGNRRGARELLKRIVRRPYGWFSTFLKVLKDTEHTQLLLQLTGESPNSPTADGNSGSAAAAEPSSAPEEDIIVEEVEEIDLYAAENGDVETLPDELEAVNPDESGATDEEMERSDIVLRDYQMEVARPALEGENIIICLPTGSGKTRVAVYIAKKHLEQRRAEGRPGKVVVLVNKVPLVEQHYAAEFLPFLEETFQVARVSGDSQLKISFVEIMKKNDVIICTAQILENFLDRSKTGDDEGLDFGDMTLVIIDECHHTQKGEVYNHIMMRYLKQKHKNIRSKKLDKKIVPLPQILGLTASPGVGGASKIEKAVEHILRICANLDASKIMTGNLGAFKKQPEKLIIIAEDRRRNPFEDMMKKMMSHIHTHANLHPTCALGSQNYEQWVVQQERKAAKNGDLSVRVCAKHLDQYCEAVQLSNTIRLSDAFNFLDKYYEEEMKKKSPDVEHEIHITDTERFLFKLFRDNKEALRALAQNPEYENDSLSKLRTRILQEFSTRKEARGIIFTKTRRSAMALCHWVHENPKFDDLKVKAAFLIGGGHQSIVKPMTSAEQESVLDKFRRGEINLLIATTVAEEGLDIAACNFVIRYGLVTNEIAMIQAQGRGRADDSSYTLVGVKGSGVVEKESVNEYRKSIMDKAIAKIRTFNQEDYDKRITEFQLQAIMEAKVRKTKDNRKKIKQEDPANLKLICRGCNKFICSGDNIQVIENMHKVNVSPEFSELFIQTENTSLQERLLDYETNGFISCKECGQRWGSMMHYRGIDCPCLHVKNFVVSLNGENISKCAKWSHLPINFSAFDYAEHARHMADDSDDSDTD
ncbi:interferon-induced helicase C domain-containing protein 1 [Synchiropus splendidus]|uniref:interferon-induced helicase C domain-containing protein 1 n=1 Tax=Synchiropus splendidus TaxID=270530 RepID=UPI00237DFD68|nr:interferon-induced helicase C domain-containing protein 1 [Synchiropus splendidus]